MRLGINGTGLVQRASIDAVVNDAAKAAADGFKSYWLAEHPTGGFDALTVLSVVGQRVPEIELGTAVIPSFPRHPLTLASQTQTVRTAIGDRLTLGIGLSHEVMMAQMGIGFEKPIRHLREYLSVLMPLLTSGKVSFKVASIKSAESSLSAWLRGPWPSSLWRRISMSLCGLARYDMAQNTASALSGSMSPLTAITYLPDAACRDAAP